MRTGFLIFIAVPALVGCATARDQAAASMTGGLETLVGQPPAAAIAVLGEPVGSAEWDGREVYGWGDSDMKIITTTFFGYNGRPSSPTYATTMRREAEMYCEIRMMVGPDGLISAWDYFGNLGGCRPYAERLDLLLPAEG
jgi:hypothetical protein